MRERAPGVVVALVVLAACDGSAPAVRISEVHYHPVLEDDYVERHEFVEIYNATGGTIDLAGWQLAGETVAFEVPSGTSLAADGYLVIARDRAAVAAVWGLDPAVVVGDYAGELDNGVDTIRLIDRYGNEADVLEYDDDAPWPVGADALGAGERWLDPALRPLSAHQYKGHSLERISFDLPASEVSTWAPSPLDGSTPGRANASAAIEPPAIVIDRERTPASATDELAATLSAVGAATGVELEWFVDDVAVADEPTTRMPMVDQGGRRFVASVPAVGEGVVVRYRVLADRGAGAGVEVISPRPTDPYRWHAYATTPAVATATRTYHLQISPRAWGRMWTNVVDGRDSGCTINSTWNDEVPAVVLFDHKVYDVMVRYQGSRYNRTNGPSIPSWPYPGPDTGPIAALSWHISFPRYRKLEGRGDLILNKNTQGCPGLDAGVGFQLFRDAGIPASEARYARLHINGGYYHYMIDIERPGEEMMARYGEVGDLYKSVGGAEGNAFGWGDERALGPNCGLSATVRYGLTYDRKTHSSWGTPAAVQALIEELDAARAAGVAAERAFFADRFDLERLLDYMAIINWSVPFDDMFQNHFLYQRRDGRWMLMPWDLDLDFGGWKPATASLYVGEEGDPDNRSGWWNLIKDSFLASYRPEFEARMRAMVDGPLSPAVVGPKIDTWTSFGNLAEASAAPAGLACGDFATRAASWHQFVVERADVVRTRIP